MKRIASVIICSMFIFFVFACQFVAAEDKLEGDEQNKSKATTSAKDYDYGHIRELMLRSPADVPKESYAELLQMFHEMDEDQKAQFIECAYVLDGTQQVGNEIRCDYKVSNVFWALVGFSDGELMKQWTEAGLGSKNFVQVQTDELIEKEGNFSLMRSVCVFAREKHIYRPSGSQEHLMKVLPYEGITLKSLGEDDWDIGDYLIEYEVPARDRRRINLDKERIHTYTIKAGKAIFYYFQYYGCSTPGNPLYESSKNSYSYVPDINPIYKENTQKQDGLKDVIIGYAFYAYGKAISDMPTDVSPFTTGEVINCVDDKSRLSMTASGKEMALFLLEDCERYAPIWFRGGFSLYNGKYMFTHYSIETEKFEASKRIYEAIEGKKLNFTVEDIIQRLRNGTLNEMPGYADYSDWFWYHEGAERTEAYLKGEYEIPEE